MNRPEQEFHRAVASLLQIYFPEGESEIVWTHVPLGGQRGGKKNRHGVPIEAAILKGMGAKAGIPDFILLWKTGCAGIELKSAEGKASASQKEMRKWFAAAGVPYLSAYDLEAVQNCLRLLISERGMPAPARGRL